MDKESFDRDLERFQVEIMSQLESGMREIKSILSVKEIKLRNDMHSAVGGFLSYMKDRYGNGVVR